MILSDGWQLTELAKLKVRRRDVDTPEKGCRTKSQVERDAARAAATFVRWSVGKARVVLARGPAWGKWNGRLIADPIPDDRSLSATPGGFGHGWTYVGNSRGSWCK